MNYRTKKVIVAALAAILAPIVFALLWAVRLIPVWLVIGVIYWLWS